MEKDRPARLLCCVYFPLQPQRRSPDTNASGWTPFRRCLPLSFLGPSNRLAVRPCWLRSLLGRDHRPLQHEALVEEVNLESWLSPQVCQPLFRPVCVFSPLFCA